jgi:hypothetical protein
MNAESDRIFNMDMLFLERIDRRLDDLDKATIAGDQFIRYRVLHTLFIDTFFKYKDMADAIVDRFTEVKAVLNAPNPSRSQSAQHQAVVFSESEAKLDNLHFIIIELLYQNDLIYLKRKEKLDPTLEVERDYG